MPKDISLPIAAPNAEFESGEPQRLAAIDLGSNSFHLLVANYQNERLQVVARLGEKVQLAAGLDENGYLSEAAMQRALDCLGRFAPFLTDIEGPNLRIVGTNALRDAYNSQTFIERAEAQLGHAIEIIAGREEARLIYLGVSHTLADDGDRRIVIDIGGGSTEFIIGQRFEAKALESLHMGCVSFTKRFFADGKITKKNFRDAVTAAEQELMNIQAQYKTLGWDDEIGSSGTIRAVEQAIILNGYGEEGITPEGLAKITEDCLKFDTLNDVNINGVKPDRRQVFIGGVAILTAIFQVFNLKHMRYSDGALREGALWDLVGRSSHEDVRGRTIQSMQERFYVDQLQAQRVENTVRELFAQVQKDIPLSGKDLDWVVWAARLYEVGLSISHSGFHKHGAYLLQHSDMLGFTRQSQLLLAILVRNHRRKIHKEEFSQLSKRLQNKAPWMVRLLRIAVVLNHSREAFEVPVPALQAAGDSLTLTMPEGWLEAHPLTARDLEEEAGLQSGSGMPLALS
ncbi:MAG TPA: exopolyphosphatase [Oceanospirillales bacterium]|nr:exopolyphosphatase [Oceanospirillales bacterium]